MATVENFAYKGTRAFVPWEQECFWITLQEQGLFLSFTVTFPKKFQGTIEFIKGEQEINELTTPSPPRPLITRTTAYAGKRITLRQRPNHD